MKAAYIDFLNHCYIDTEVEMKEIYTSNHMWTLFDSFLVDMVTLSTSTLDRARADKVHKSIKPNERLCVIIRCVTPRVALFVC